MTFARIGLLLILLLPLLVFESASASTPEAGSTPAHDPGPNFVFHPKGEMDGAYFTIEAQPGTTHTLTAYMGNVADEPVTLRTYSGDAYSLVNGGFGVREEGEPVTEVGTWLDWPAETVTFGPGEGAEQSFTVSVPEGVAPGEYIAGLVVQTAEPVAIEGSDIFDQMMRRSVAVFVIVPGDTTAGLSLGEPDVEIDTSTRRLVLPIENTGNVLLKPAGELVITTTDGSEVLRHPIAMGSVYAGHETTLEIGLPPMIPAGEYDVALALGDEATGVQESLHAQVQVPDISEGATGVVVEESSVTAMPEDSDTQFAAISLSLENRGASLGGVRLVVIVERDGSLVEEYTIGESLTLQPGATLVEQRYVPLEGWAPGEWSFQLRAEIVDPQSGATMPLLEDDIGNPIEITG